MTFPATALIADDEPLLREALRGQLATLWPGLRVVAEARNGLDALEQFEQSRPAVCFLDIHMPGLNGVEVARRIAGRAHVVFVTAFDQYALDAFEQGAFDYLVKPLQAARLAGTVSRLQERLRRDEAPRLAEALLARLSLQLSTPSSGQLAASSATAPAVRPQPAAAPLRWIKATVDGAVRLIPVEDIAFLRSDEKYTLVAWRGDHGPAEALIRTPLKTLVDHLDPSQFQQVHRSVIVNLAAIARVVATDERASLHLKGRPEVLPVSRSFAAFFKAE
jgi:DNA-binding LytR/AlgR family response regulator